MSKVNYQKILARHADQTRERMKQQKVVLLVRDTSELDVTRLQEQVLGAGILNSSCCWGVLLDAMVAFTTDGTPRGTYWAKLWTREELAEEPRAEKEKRRRKMPLEENQSVRWIERLRQARTLAQEMLQVQCIGIADSVGDINEWFSEPWGEQPVEWLVRTCQDRALLPDAENGAQEVPRLEKLVEAQPVWFTPRDRGSRSVSDQGIVRKTRWPSAASQPNGEGRNSCGHGLASPAVASWSQASCGGGQRRAGMRKESAGGRCASKMAVADHLAQRDGRSGGRDPSILYRALSD